MLLDDGCFGFHSNEVNFFTANSVDEFLIGFMFGDVIKPVNIVAVFLKGGCRKSRHDRINYITRHRAPVPLELPVLRKQGHAWSMQWWITNSYFHIYSFTFS